MQQANAVHHEPALRVACVGVSVPGDAAAPRRAGAVALETVPSERFEAYLEASLPAPPATVILGGEGAHERLAKLRARREYDRTRVFIVGPPSADTAWD